MKPWIELDRATAPGGSVLVLCQRGRELVIRVDGFELMGSRASASEVQLAVLGCAGLRDVPRARILIGGLGMGFTLRAALRCLAEDARVDVAELVPAVVRWNRGVLGPLAGAPLEDPRTHVVEEDVATVLKRAEGEYHAVLLDVDNGPSALTAPENARLYDAAGLTRARRALLSGGVLAVWSTGDDAKFTARLGAAGFRVRVERPTATFSGGRRHVVWVARKEG